MHEYDILIWEKMTCTTEEKRTLLPLIDRMEDLSMRARRDGILSVEAALPQLEPPLLRRGMRLAVDGTDPDVIHPVLYNYALSGGASGVRLFENFLIVEGVMAIQQGLNPRMVREALLSLMGEDFVDEMGKQ